MMRRTTTNEFGRRLRAARCEIGITQEFFAVTLGVAHSLISLLEAGKRQPTLPFLLAVEYVHGIKMAWLLHGEPPIWRGAIPAAGPQR